jgi:hypothetical protein
MKPASFRPESGGRIWLNWPNSGTTWRRRKSEAHLGTTTNVAAQPGRPRLSSNSKSSPKRLRRKNKCCAPHAGGEGSDGGH